MSNETIQIIKSAQCARIISCISELYGITIEDATDIFYGSDIANMVEEGVADLHCRSDKYLATEIWDEYRHTPHL